MSHKTIGHRDVFMLLIIFRIKIPFFTFKESLIQRCKDKRLVQQGLLLYSVKQPDRDLVHKRIQGA